MNDRPTDAIEKGGNRNVDELHGEDRRTLRYFFSREHQIGFSVERVGELQQVA
jgi:hypothetical protein